MPKSSKPVNQASPFTGSHSRLQRYERALDGPNRYHGTGLAELNWPDPTLYQSGKTRLQELAELFWPQPGGSKDRAQGATIKRPVVRYNDLSKRVIAPQDNMAAHLSNEAESYPLEGPLTNSAGNDWQVAHTVTRRASKCSSGTGSRSASSAST